MNKPEPKIFCRKSKRETLEPGTYAWCACGHSADGLFCDGSHRGKAMVPIVFDVTETQEICFCLCKHSKNPPYCDGSHRDLPAEE